MSLWYAFGTALRGWGGGEEERRSLALWLATSVTEFTGARSGPVQPGEPAYQNRG